jgi:hypothetical protein
MPIMLASSLSYISQLIGQSFRQCAAVLIEETLNTSHIRCADDNIWREVYCLPAALTAAAATALARTRVPLNGNRRKAAHREGASPACQALATGWGICYNTPWFNNFHNATCRFPEN